MPESVDRRAFLKITTAATAGLAMGAQTLAQGAEPASSRKVRVGVIGTGRRGTGHLHMLLRMGEAEIPAVCDIDPPSLERAAKAVVDAGQSEPTRYGDGPQAYRKMLERDDLEAVIICTPWDLHAPMAVEAMKAGKYAGVEVPCAITFDECWELVNTHEETGVPCMMLENWSFRRDNLAVLNMIRKGLFGDIVHCHCAHSHDCIDHWFFNPDGKDRWPARFLIERNCDQYPTHSLGPVLSWMDINCGDAFASITSTATASKGINAYFARKFGPDHPGAKRKYAQGDIVTSVVRTHQGKSIVINYDMQLPRPYDNRWLIQGTLGLYNEQRESLYVLDRSPEYHKWESFGPYQEQFDHAWWKDAREKAEKFGHGGTDYIELHQFLAAVRSRTQTVIDVYDSVTMSVITPASEASIARGSAPVEVPDFTRGRWKTRKPTFAVEV